VVDYLRVFRHVGFFLVFGVGVRSEFLVMSPVLMKDRLPSEVLDSDTYNRLQMRRAIQTRGDPTAETPISTAGELLRVLIVDDYRASADTMAMLIDVWGHDVRRTYDGPTGLALAAAYQPDVLLLDIIMPGMTGLEVARRVRQQTRLNDCYMIAITGRTDAGNRLRCEAAGIDLFLIKPVTPSILQALLTWEYEYVLRSRQHAETYNVFSTTFEQLTDSNSHPTTQSPCHILQGAVASSQSQLV
jgi:CheY-like chemotaxis protein